MIGIYGGTFDPIHNGHLRSAIELVDILGLSEMRMIPCGLPPHRDRPTLEKHQRFELVKIAVRDEPRFVVDDQEIQRSGSSYTVDTLTTIRNQIGDTPLCLIIGMDAFLEFDTWHQWQEIPKLAHIVVMHRPNYDVNMSSFCSRQLINSMVQQRQTNDIDSLLEQNAGKLLTQSVTQLEISSSQIRSLIAAGKSIRYLVPEQVRELIEENGYYR